MKSVSTETSAFTSFSSPKRKLGESKDYKCECIKKNIVNPLSLGIPSISRYTFSLDISPSSSSSWNRDIFASKRESAVLVDWDPVPEIQRRIEQGIEYEHWPEYGRFGYGSTKSNKKWTGTASIDESHCVRAVIASLRVTTEERNRLKSAHPED